MDVPQILDLASGGGEPSFNIARSIPKAHVICTDLSDGMIEKVRRRPENPELAGTPPLELNLYAGQGASAVHGPHQCGVQVGRGR